MKAFRQFLIPRMFLAGCVGLLATAAYAQNGSIALHVDATDVARKILHARLEIPAQPGNLTLVYPKWIPGEHGPTGPINQLTGIKMSAGGKPLAWQRDNVDMYAFHLTVPAGANNVEVALDFLLPSGEGQYSAGPSLTAQLLDLSWNQVLLYPQGAKADDIQFAATLHLPAGWEFGTALPLARETPDGLEFSPVTLERLVDSPLIAGHYFRTIDLTPGQNPTHYIHMVADSAAALDMKPEDIQHFQRLVAETGTLFGARHYRSYHFLLTLSDHVAHFGLEHHESSDNRTDEKFLTDEKTRKLEAELLPHEMAHSWNGKYRRPAGLATPDFQQPMKDELLWVYEGLTEYLGEVLAARCGLWTNGDFHQALALTAAGMQDQAGRKWRPLLDTTVAAQLLYEAPPEGTAWRRSVDFYPEGVLIWLEADTIIRQQSHGHRSLDDFCRAFFGGQSGPPSVISYTLDDVLAALNEVAAYDWREFFQNRVYDLAPRAPLGGITNSGWRLAYTNKPPELFESREKEHKFTDLRSSLGLVVKEDGTVLDVIPGSPADNAGIAPNAKLVAVNDRRWTPDILRTALESTKTNSAPLELLVENDDYFKTCKLDYHAGEKYPCVERDATRPDLLGDILKPRAPVPASAGGVD
jgi:predicted metalloprotease with PDZ domain